MLTIIFLSKIDTIILPVVVLLLLEAFNAITKNAFTLKHVIIAAIVFLTGLISPIAWFTAQVSLKPFAVIHVVATIILAIVYLYRCFEQ
ncbi:hypothetical protein [Pseudobutyrivibrio ruminis]|uniref:hypothetical protein n=1 Tax=Pseudobutyrivibrio ruminis TaxID=46206 RepID=UPI00051B5078|nr:hypothetical protein [Pseudobutyrivibrio ruminis]